MTTWYAEGHIVATVGCVEVRGLGGTNWNSDPAKDQIGPGALLIAAGHAFVIEAVDTVTQVLTLTEAWAGELPSAPLPGASNYRIIASPTAQVEAATPSELRPRLDSDPVYVASYATMEDVSSITNTGLTAIEVASYGTVGADEGPDGGGGALVYDTGTITPSSEPPGIQFPAVTGRFIRPTDGIVHSKWFGVRHDGTSDQSTPMQNFINEIVSATSVYGSDRIPGSYLGGDGYLGFIDAGTIDCNGATLYISGNDAESDGMAGTSSGRGVLGRAFRGAGKFGTVIMNAAISVGDLPGALTNSPQSSSVSLSSFALEGYLDLWSPQDGTIMDRLGIRNPSTVFKREYTSGHDALDESLCNILHALQTTLFGCVFQASANPLAGGGAAAVNAVRANTFTNLNWMGGGVSVIYGAPDSGVIGFKVDSMIPDGIGGFLDNPSGAKLTLRDLHLEGLRQEAIFLQSVTAADISCHVRTYVGHDNAHPSVQLGNPEVANTNCKAATVRSCHATSDGGADSFLQATWAEGLDLKDNYIQGFARGVVIGSTVSGFATDASSQVPAAELPTFSASAIALLSPNLVTGSVAGTILSVTSGTVSLGQTVEGPGVPVGTLIIAGSGSTFTLSNAGMVASTGLATAPTSAVVVGSITAGGTMVVTGLVSGTLAVGQIVSGATASGLATITGVGSLTGGGGGIGTYSVSGSITAAPGVLAAWAGPVAAVVKGSISGTTLTATGTVSGALGPGLILIGAGLDSTTTPTFDQIAPGTVVESGAGSSWQISIAQTVLNTGTVEATILGVASAAFAANAGIDGATDVLTVGTGTVTGSLAPGQIAIGGASATSFIPPGTTIVTPLEGAYVVSAASYTGGTGITLAMAAPTNPGTVNFSGSITGTVLTVATMTSGTLEVGQIVAGAGVISGTMITKFNTNASGGVGGYTVSENHTATATGTVATPAAAVATGTISNGAGGSGTIMAITSVTSGTLAAGQLVFGAGVTAGTTLTSLSSGVGSYLLGVADTSFDIHPSAMRDVFDPLSDAPLDLGLQTGVLIELGLQNNPNIALTLSETHEIRIFSTEEALVPGLYSLVISKSHSTDKIGSWASGMLFPGGVVPDLSAMTLNQVAVITIQAVNLATSTTPAMLCDCVIYGNP